MDRFGRASTLKVNVSKSRAMFSLGIPTTKSSKSTEITQIKKANSLEKYLGFPLHYGQPARKDFEFITDIMCSKLSSWKHRLLNRVERIACASSVLNSIPTYYM